MGAAGVVGDVAADGAGALARGVRRVEQAVVLAGMGEVHVDEPGAGAREAVGWIDLEDLTHARGRHDHATCDRARAAGKARARAARNDGHAEARDQLHARRGLGCVRGQDHQIRLLVVHGQRIGLIAHQPRRIRDHGILANQPNQPVNQRLIHGGIVAGRGSLAPRQPQKSDRRSFHMPSSNIKPVKAKDDRIENHTL